MHHQTEAPSTERCRRTTIGQRIQRMLQSSRSLCVKEERGQSIQSRSSNLSFPSFVPRLELEDLAIMFGNIVPMTTVGSGQVHSGNVLPNNSMGNNDLVIIQDTGTATSQAELINQLQNHITENQQILIITDDQGQDQCKST